MGFNQELKGGARAITHRVTPTATARQSKATHHFPAFIGSIPGSIAALLRSEQRRLSPWLALSVEGLELVRDQPVEHRERMQEFHDLYAFFQREMPAITDDFLAARKGIS